MEDLTGREQGRIDRYLGVGAAALAYLFAAVHLFHPTHGFARLVLVLSVDPGLLLADPRPLAFVFAGAAVLLAVPAVVRGAPRRLVAGLGLALMGLTIAGYLAWHLSGHGGFLPGREPIHDGMRPVEALLAHLRTDPWAAASLLTEGLLAAVLSVIVVRDGPG